MVCSEALSLRKVKHKVKLRHGESAYRQTGVFCHPLNFDFAQFDGGGKNVSTHDEVRQLN